MAGREWRNHARAREQAESRLRKGMLEYCVPW